MTLERGDPGPVADRPPLLSGIVVMGVSGSGKSTVASALAERLGWVYADGDAFHPPGNVAKMAAGTPLTDADREPWLRLIAAWIAARCTERDPGVVACSALKRRYRAILLGEAPEGAARIVYLKGELALIEERMRQRAGHFMPASLLESQFRTLEQPTPSEGVIAVDIAGSPQDIVAEILRRLPAELCRSPD